MSDADQPGEAVADRPGVTGDAAADRPGVTGDAAADRPGVTGEARTAAATRQAVMATTSVSGGNVVSGETALRLLSAAAEARLPVDVAGCSQSVVPTVASTSYGPAALSSVLSLSTYDPDWPALGQLPPDTGRAFSSSRRLSPRKANNGRASEHCGDARGESRGRQLLTIVPRYFYPQIWMYLQ